MTKILLFGKNGQVGWEAWRVLSCLGEVAAFDYPEVDFTRPDSLKTLIDDLRPDIIYNAAAYTAVDRAETEVEACRYINAVAPAVIAESARKHHAVMVHISTDYVFDGAKGSAYVETDSPNPLNVYGQTKLEGEQAVEAAGGTWLTFRTSWVYSSRRESFVRKVLEWSQGRKELRIVDDQISGPTWSRSLAEITALLLARALKDPYAELADTSGCYHLSGWGWASRMEWAAEILRIASKDNPAECVQVLPAKSSDFPSPAARPLFSALDCSKFESTFGLRLPDWRTALALTMAGIPN